MTPSSLLRRILERPLYRWAAVSYIVIAAMGAVFAFSQILVESQMRSEHDVAMWSEYQKQALARMNKVEEEVQLMQNLLQVEDFDLAKLDQLRSTISEVQKLQAKPVSSILDRLGELEKRTTEVCTGAWRPARSSVGVNPTRPAGNTSSYLTASCHI